MEESEFRKSMDQGSPRSDTDYAYIIDELVRQLNILIGGNISLQDIIVSILNRNVQSQINLLKEIHILNKRVNTTAQKFKAKITVLKDMRQIQVGDNIFRRLYSRLIEKLSRKFSIYDSHRRKLGFLSSSIKVLFRFHDESLLRQNQRTLHLFVDALQVIITENAQLYEFLLNLLVSQNYVSSIQQFNLFVMEDEIQEKQHVVQNNQEESENSDGQRPSKLDNLITMVNKVNNLQMVDLETRLTIEQLFKRLKSHNERTLRKSARLNNLNKSALRNKGTSKIYNSLQKLFLQSIQATNASRDSSKRASVPKFDHDNSQRFSKFSGGLTDISNFSPYQSKSKIKKVNRKNKALNSSQRIVSGSGSRKPKLKVPIRSAFGKCLERQPRQTVIIRNYKKNITQSNQLREEKQKTNKQKQVFYKKYQTMIDQFVENIEVTPPKRPKKDLMVLQPVVVAQQSQTMPEQVKGVLTVRAFRFPGQQGPNIVNDFPDFSTTLGRQLDKPFTNHCKSAQSGRRKVQTQREINQKDFLQLNQARLRRIRALRAKLAKTPHKIEIFCPRQLKITLKSLH